jgi:hypothetical protein
VRSWKLYPFVYSSLSFSPGGRFFSETDWTIIPLYPVMGSVPWACEMCQYACRGWICRACSIESPHLHVLLSSLLPLLGHGAGPDGAGEHASESEDSESAEADSDGQEENLATLIRRRRTAGAMGTERNEISCVVKMSLA